MKSMPRLEKYALETICNLMHYRPGMKWTVLFHPEFLPEFFSLPEEVRVELLARTKVIEAFGPNIGRPHVDTLQGSSFGNMKELRFQLDGLWHFAFAFDPRRNALVLCGGDKLGENAKAFYKNLIAIADARFAAHIAVLKAKAKAGQS
jgi:hypothetical protein